MTLEQLRESGWIIYEVISGSHAYGLNVEGSDIDIRGIYIQPTNTLLGTVYYPQISDSKNDITFFEIGRFLELAAKGNPNILELLNVPEECVVYKHPNFGIYVEPHKDIFITTKLRHTFTGYAYAQIKKAKGLNKKINWDEARTMRKDVLDFCYVLKDKERSVLYRDAVNRFDNNAVGLAKVNNFPDLYSMYFVGIGNGGIIGDNSNDVQLRSIPKDAEHLGYLRFDRNAYSQHCKDYNKYKKWLEERNDQRYADNLKGEVGYDHKNMMHCMRLLHMAEDIALGKGIVVKRPERAELLAIRNGEIPYETLLETAETTVEKIKELFDSTELPREVSPKFINNLLTEIRIENLPT